MYQSDRSLRKTTTLLVDGLLAPVLLLLLHAVLLVRLFVWPLHWPSSLTALRIVVTTIAIGARTACLHVDGPCDKWL